MSKLYEKYLLLKSKNINTIYLFKNGIFYILLDNDARIMSTLLNLKLTNLNDTVVKCGFPVNNLDKYLTLIKNLGYDVCVIDNPLNEFSKSNYIINSKIKNFFKELSCIDTNSLSINEAFLLINRISSTAKTFIKEMNFK